MKLTVAQWFSIVLGVLGVLVGASGQLSDLGLSAGAVQVITAACGLLIAIISTVGAVVTGQRQQLISVANMEGVEHVRLSDKASPELVAMGASTEPNLVKIVPPKEPPSQR